MKNKKGPIILSASLIVIGLLVMFYPTISNFIARNSQGRLIAAYETDASKLKKEQNKKLLEEAYNYNKSLKTTSIQDAFTSNSHNVDEKYYDLLNVSNNGIIGYISIPKIDVKLPIYHGTSNEVLQKGVGHLEESSLPVGGSSTHSILSAHRGLPSSKLFTDLDQVSVGDTFYIYVLDQVLAYKVESIKVIEPNDTKSLEIQEGRDLVTLVTCTPYAINTHRLLVTGTRVDYNPSIEASVVKSNLLSKTDVILYLGILILILIIFIYVLLLSYDKKTNNKNNINKKPKVKEEVKKDNKVKEEIEDNNDIENTKKYEILIDDSLINIDKTNIAIPNKYIIKNSNRNIKNKINNSQNVQNIDKPKKIHKHTRHKRKNKSVNE